MKNYKFRGKTTEGIWKHGSYVGVRGNIHDNPELLRCKDVEEKEIKEK